jgi:coenzyme F420-0:L-glutamate ligase/coenzyme F420-1:gamma-L-glutamate ligase
LVDLILKAASFSRTPLQDGDVLVIAHTIVSKAEGRMVWKDQVEVSSRAQTIADENGFDPVQVELALRESIGVLRTNRVLVTERADGTVCNFSGVDKSNAPDGHYLLLPLDSDRSAEAIRVELENKTGFRIGVVISDTQGRPWRRGIVNLALGCSGVGAFKHNRGRKDLYGRTLEHSLVCRADEIAAAAEPIMGQAGEGLPVVIVRGMELDAGPEFGKDIPRPKNEDIFR